MSRAVALSRLQELGIRGRDDPPAQPTQWAGMEVGDGGLRALHEALHPSLLLLTLAGYHIDQVVLGRPGDGDVLLVDHSPRAATVVSWGEYLETGGEPEWPFTADFTVLMWLKPRPGLGGDPVVVLDETVIEGFPYLALDVDAAADLGAIASGLPAVQEPVRERLAAWITHAWWQTDWSVATTGLLSALEPDLWTFPELDDSEDLRRQAFRRLAEHIAIPALETEPSLEAFLLEEAAVRDDGRPPSVRDRLAWADQEEVADLERAWNAEAEALWREMHEDGREPFRRADLRRLSYCELVFDMLNEGLISLAGYDGVMGEGAYGGYDLRRGDNDPAPGDTEWTYAGATVTGTRTQYIDELRRDLDAIGFGPLADGDTAWDPIVDGGDPVDDDNHPSAAEVAARRLSFGGYLEAAVREFQTYASGDVVARFRGPGEPLEAEHPSRATQLVSQDNDQPYTGPLSGVLNAQTRTLLKMWVERDWHCPVVVEARKLSTTKLRNLRNPDYAGDKAAIVTGTAIDAAHENLWRRTEFQVVPPLERPNYTFIAWDFTQHYPAPPTRPWGVPVAVSKWSDDSWGGAFAKVARQTWPEAELRPENLYDEPLDPARRPQQGAFWSTFRVIRAISEVECQGVLDGMNAYDSAIASGGPLHFTLGLTKREDGVGLSGGPGDCVVYPGELCPALSVLAHEDELEYERFFGVFGLRPREPWADPPTAMFSSGHRKYRGWILQQDESGAFVDLRKVTPETYAVDRSLAVSREDYLLAEALHHWHWLYRWQMAPRLSRHFREITYRFARARLRALLSAPWGGLGGAPAGLRLGDIFTSEKAVAIIERLHVWSPRKLFDLEDIDVEWLGRRAANIKFTRLEAAYKHAKDLGGADPSTWGDAEEARLIKKLLELIAIKPDIEDLVKWPEAEKWEDAEFGMDLRTLAMEESPVIGAILPLSAPPGAETRTRFPVSDRETEPGGCDVSATSADEDVLVVALEDAGDGFYDLVLTPPEGADGEVTVTIHARDLRHATTREVRVNVSADFAAPVDQPAPYVQPPPVGLSEQRRSFEIDDFGLFAQPPD